jgi:hypothetical protein
MPRSRNGVPRKRNKLPLTMGQARVRKWILSNRGRISQIAEALKVSEQFVSAVAYGRTLISPGHPVERKLREAGWSAPSR